ncbi:N amino acid transport system protein [Dothidotthia symphoricarpi CBS 119687]|uniref:N amino acid transport system protein n=1 Tax=Dothidotthia symphoricarpi CBS 119687 TaxID=1392245 RepID=A0A6A6A8P5_9PLEO|nr:N amino acid transport system protein [Dothidotthia symphoricarpi CBS 119687]KAF2127197.1 N amino acid transport system protein [Dothidotthia symphoricarpi CBS 119687]
MATAYERTVSTPEAQLPSREKTKNSNKQILQQQSTIAADSEGQSAAVMERDVFGNEEGAETAYKTCEWWHTGILMIAGNVSLGVLALPQALAILGLVPGLLCICFLGLIATYTGWIIGEFKLAHPQVHSFADCGFLIAGPIGREVLAVAQVFILIFVMGAHLLTFAVAMNAITEHGACTIVFSVVGLTVCFLLGLPRTFKNVSYCSIFSCLSIIIAVLVAMIAIGIEKSNKGDILAVRKGVPLVKGLGPVLNIVLAYTGHVAFFSFQAELRNPRDFNKALVFSQSIAITFYMTISVVIYYFAGPLVASPALGSASPLMSKVCFGIAIPTIVIAGVIAGSVACKYIYIRVWAGTDVVHSNSWTSVGSWVGICAGIWCVSWVLAEAVPNFNLLLGLVGALFGSWFSYAIPPVLWMYQHKGRLFSSKKMIALTVMNCAVCLMGLTIFGLGMWSSGWELNRGSGGKVFSCANNWNPVSWVGEDAKSH